MGGMGCLGSLGRTIRVMLSKTRRKCGFGKGESTYRFNRKRRRRGKRIEGFVLKVGVCNSPESKKNVRLCD
jgi:hypothetical protein